MGIIETIKKIEREEGFERGMEKGKEQVVKNLLAADKFSISEIAGFAGVAEAFVKKIRVSLKKKK